MSAHLDQLYQQVILDHNKSPRNFILLDRPTHQAHGHNPLCGDDYVLELKIEDGIITEVGINGAGCAISKASASIMGTVVKGKPVDESLQLKECFLSLVTQDDVSADCRSKLGKLAIFEGVKKFPVRVKCAALIWRAFEAAIASPVQAEVLVSTE